MAIGVNLLSARFVRFTNDFFQMSDVFPDNYYFWCEALGIHGTSATNGPQKIYQISHEIIIKKLQ